MRLPSVVLAFSLLGCAACGGGSSGPTPVEQSGVPIAWTGTALRILEVHGDGIDLLKTWEISNLTWVEDVDAEVTPLNGARLFELQSGSVKLTIVLKAGGCTSKGTTTFTLEPGDGSLVVGARYAGSIQRSKQEDVDVYVDCGASKGPGTLRSGEMALLIDDTGDKARSKNRLQGTTTFDVTTTVHTSTWDFKAIAWEL